MQEVWWAAVGVALGHGLPGHLEAASRSMLMPQQRLPNLRIGHFASGSLPQEIGPQSGVLPWFEFWAMPDDSLEGYWVGPWPSHWHGEHSYWASGGLRNADNAAWPS